jgi:hypothetical protein
MIHEKMQVGWIRENCPVHIDKLEETQTELPIHINKWKNKKISL